MTRETHGLIWLRMLAPSQGPALNLAEVFGQVSSDLSELWVRPVHVQALSGRDLERFGLFPFLKVQTSPHFSRASCQSEHLAVHRGFCKICWGATSLCLDATGSEGEHNLPIVTSQISYWDGLFKPWF